MMEKAIKKEQYFASLAPIKDNNFSVLRAPDNNRQRQIIREPTILGRLSSLTNFDYMGMTNQTSKLYTKLNTVLQKNNEKINPKAIFTEQIF